MSAKILNLYGTTNELKVPEIFFDKNTDYCIQIIDIGCNLMTTPRDFDTAFVKCTSIASCYGLPNTLMIGQVRQGDRWCHFPDQCSLLFFPINIYNWRETKFSIDFSEPKPIVQQFWIQILIKPRE